jgi:hypothetical protein
MQRNRIAVSRDKMAVNMRLASKIDRSTWLLREAAVTIPAVTVTQDMGERRTTRRRNMSYRCIT